MSVNPRKFKRKKQEIEDIKEKIAFESDLIYLNFLKLELKHSINNEKLQKLIHKKQGWRNYTR